MERVIQVPAFVINGKYNIDVAYKYREKYGNDDIYINSFFDAANGELTAKPEFLDCVKKMPYSKVSILFVVNNDASVAGRKYQESYFCQTPICYGFDDLLRLFEENVPMVRQRNAEQTTMEPLVPKECTIFFVLKALIESSFVNNKKSITLTIGSKSIKISYTFNPGNQDNREIDIKKEYFDTWGFSFDEFSCWFEKYIKKHRSTYRFSYFKGTQTLELLFNVRKATFKRYANVKDIKPLLTKTQYDIYNFVLDRGGASAQLIADEFGFKSSRAVRYHLERLIALKLLKRIGEKGSHNVIYRIY